MRYNNNDELRRDVLRDVRYTLKKKNFKEEYTKRYEMYI